LQVDDEAESKTPFLADHANPAKSRRLFRANRPQRKRCEFLAIEKPRRDGSGTYEQVFFRTESGIRAHRSRSRVELRTAPTELSVVIDSAERYPWAFPGASVTKRKLPVGDYGLMIDERLTAIVERKSFDNLLGDIGALQALHHQLADLARTQANEILRRVAPLTGLERP